MNFDAYDPQSFYDEYFEAAGKLRPELAPILQWFQALPSQDMPQIKAKLEAVLEELGATFSFEGEDRVLPFDPVPRVISAEEWKTLTAGLTQRVTALNMFCADVYSAQRIITEDVIPRDVIESALRFRPECMGMKPPNDIWCHISGIDLVRNGEGNWYVLEDNLRVPSGIAYVLKNRIAMERVLPELMAKFEPSRVDDYAQQLRVVMDLIAPAANSSMALLTPGTHSSAYFEHQLLAEQMGIALISPEDVVMSDGYLCYRTDSDDLQRLDVVYRRGDTEMFADLDLGEDYPDSIATLIDLCQQGKLAVANAIGAGIGDDKVIYAYVPDMIRFYLDEEPLLPNVPTYLCWRDRDRDYVLNHLEELVVKAASAEGGDDMLVGVNSTAEERQAFAQKIKEKPREYMAQPTVYLSQIPTVVDGGIEGRHTDLRPYVLHQGDKIHVHPGGLTRVALEKGQLVVNSSQGGGAKDTWVLRS